VLLGPLLKLFVLQVIHFLYTVREILPNTVIIDEVEENSFIDFQYVWKGAAESIAIGINPSTLMISILEVYPHNVSSTDGSLRFQNTNAAKNFTNIRVRWTNQHQGTVKFNLNVLSTNFTDDDEYFMLIIIFVVLLIISTTLFARILDRQRSRLRQNAMDHYKSVPKYSVPKGDRFLMTLQSEANLLPVSIEPIKSSYKTEFLAVTYFVLLPGQERFLVQGDLPPFSFGTRIVALGKLQISNYQESKSFKPSKMVKNAIKPNNKSN
jgi:hypothetical protein